MEVQKCPEPEDSQIVTKSYYYCHYYVMMLEMLILNVLLYLLVRLRDSGSWGLMCEFASI